MLACGASGPAEGAAAGEGVIILGRAAVTSLGLELTVGSICGRRAWPMVALFLGVMLEIFQNL